jgi:hypothetical protein
MSKMEKNKLPYSLGVTKLGIINRINIVNCRPEGRSERKRFTWE